MSSLYYNKSERESEDAVQHYKTWPGVAQAVKEIESNITRDNVKIISIDDINMRKGDKSSGCAVFMDGETHKVLIIVSGTTKEVAARALERFPSAEYLSRDKASAYSSAGEDQGKTQVADRFYLIQNAHRAVKDALSEILPAKIYIREGDGWVSAEPGGEANEMPLFHVPEHTVEERINAVGLTPAKAKKYRDTLKMLELDSKGLQMANIAQAMDMSIKDVRALRATAATTLQRVDEKIAAKASAQNVGGIKTASGERVMPSNESIVEPYRETVIELWNAGKSHREICPAIKSLGYAGSSNTIYQFILKLRKEMPDEIRPSQNRALKNLIGGDSCSRGTEKLPDLRLESASRHTVYIILLMGAASDRAKSDGDAPVSGAQKAERRVARDSALLSEETRKSVFGDKNDEDSAGKSKITNRKTLIAQIKI